MKCQRISLRKTGKELKTLLKDSKKDLNKGRDLLH